MGSSSAVPVIVSCARPPPARPSAVILGVNFTLNKPHEFVEFLTSFPVIARVEPLTRTRAVRGPFDYLLRSDQTDVRVGSVLRVPFGRRPAVGVVLDLADHSKVEPDRLVEVDAVLPLALPTDLVLLARWIA